MRPLRLAQGIFLAWVAELLAKAVFPSMALFLNPLFLLLVWLGLELPSPKSLWVFGLGLGFLKETVSGEAFGVSLCVFGLTGWLMGRYRHMIEREDRISQTILACVGSGLSVLLYGALLLLVDPDVSWNGALWVVAPISMAVSGGCAYACFPAFSRLLRR